MCGSVYSGVLDDYDLIYTWIIVLNSFLCSLFSQIDALPY